jgi:peptidoglycan/LPS O-acetylase OafA/YrhL
MTKSTSGSIYFPGLNSLRFLAATAVIFHHVEQYKSWKGQPNIWGTDGVLGAFIDAIGHKAVSLFFVLSGFLITYLLLAEMAKTGTVSLKKFYIRRILRIWPLYYIIVLTTIFLLPHLIKIGNYPDMVQQNMLFVLAVYLFMLPNLMLAKTFQVVGANQTWSVGVEEQFYIMWPYLVRKFHRVFIPFLISLVIIKMGLSLIALIGIESLHPGGAVEALKKFERIWSTFKIEQMAIGGFGAYYLFNKNTSILNWMYSKTNILLCSILFIVLFTTSFHFWGMTLIEAYVFITLILNISTNEAFPLKLENKQFTLLGNMSYGIYMWHTLCISFILAMVDIFKITPEGWAYHIALHLSSVVLTLIVSYLSYTYIESGFLKWKDKFMVVRSSTHETKKAS